MSSLTLVILDGWGLREERRDNGIALADTPVMDRLWSKHTHSLLMAHGEAVGLMPDQMGNSNVGHLNLGAGRVVYQDVMRISKAVENRSFFSNEVLVDAMNRVVKGTGRLHLLGLISCGGVHSLLDHVYSLHELARERGVKQLFVHGFLDGRDVPPRSAVEYVKELKSRQRQLGIGTIATISGRYWAMDRDTHWERTQLAYDAMLSGKGFSAENAVTAVEMGYERGEDDEFCKPTVIDKRGLIEKDDVVLLFNFRADRMRQLVRAITDSEKWIGRSKSVRDVVCMTEYDREFSLPVAFLPRDVVNTLGEVVSDARLRQFRCAETEKYAHVTYFLSGGREQPFPGEDRVLVPSPRVNTYDLQPEMSAHEVCRRAVEAINAKQHELVIVNFANPDMVGHTGVLAAAVKGCEVVDECVGKVVKASVDQGMKAVIVSDHGNAEMMRDPQTDEPHTAHTTNPVPFIVVGEEVDRVRAGGLGNVAPTVLELMGLEVPEDMDDSLID